MYVVMLGGPGAGKGTQSAIVSEEMNLPHVASGDLFRQALEQQTELGLLAKSYMDKGELGPDEIVTKMILERIDSPDCASGCLFDGFPRTLVQAEALDGILAGRGEAVDAAVYIRVSEAELVKRLSGRWICRQCQAPYHVATSPPKMVGICDKCGGELYQRSDDNEETVRKRLKVFFSQTVPIVDYYRKQGRLLEVNGNLGIAEVSKEILCALRGKKT